MSERRATSGRRSASRRRAQEQEQQQQEQQQQTVLASNETRQPMPAARQPSGNGQATQLAGPPMATQTVHCTALEQRQLRQRMQPVPSLYTLGRLSCVTPRAAHRVTPHTHNNTAAAAAGQSLQQTCLHQLKSSEAPAAKGGQGTSETSAAGSTTATVSGSPASLHTLPDTMPQEAAPQAGKTTTPMPMMTMASSNIVMQRRKSSAIAQAVLSLHPSPPPPPPCRVRPVYDQVTSRHVLLDMLRRRQRRHSEAEAAAAIAANTSLLLLPPQNITPNSQSTAAMQEMTRMPSVSVYTELKPRPMAMAAKGNGHAAAEESSSHTSAMPFVSTSEAVQRTALLSAAEDRGKAKKDSEGEEEDEDEAAGAVMTSVHETLGHLVLHDTAEEQRRAVSSHHSDREAAHKKDDEEEDGGDDVQDVDDEIEGVKDMGDQYDGEEDKEDEQPQGGEGEYASDAVGLLPVLLPHKPQGRYFVFNLLSTWGDPHEIGLCGIEMYDERGARLIPLPTNTSLGEAHAVRMRASHTSEAGEHHTPAAAAASSSLFASSAAVLHAAIRGSTSSHGAPAVAEQEMALEGNIVTLTYAPAESCVHMFAEYTATPDEIHALGEREGRRRVCHDGRRQLRSVMDGLCNTHDEAHMFALPYSPGQHHLLCFIFARPVTLSMIRIYNYCGKGRVHTSKGVRVMEVTMDDETVIFRGEVRQHSGEVLRESDLGEMDSAAIATAALANCENVLFTDEPDVLERIMQETMHDLAPDVTITPGEEEENEDEEEEEEEMHTAHEYTGTSAGMTDSSSHLTAPHVTTANAAAAAAATTISSSSHNNMNRGVWTNSRTGNHAHRRIGSTCEGDGARPMWASMTAKPASSCSSSSAIAGTLQPLASAAAVARQAGVTVVLSSGGLRERDTQVMMGNNSTTTTTTNAITTGRCTSAGTRMQRRHSAGAAGKEMTATGNNAGAAANALGRPASALCVGQASNLTAHSLVLLPPRRYPRIPTSNSNTRGNEGEGTRKAATTSATGAGAPAWASPSPLSSSSSSASSCSVGEIHTAASSAVQQTQPATASRVALYPTRCPRNVRSVCFMFLATWGDTRQIGLSGLRLRDAQGELLAADIAHWAVYYPTTTTTTASTAQEEDAEGMQSVICEAPHALLEEQMPCLFDEQPETTCLLPFQPAMLLVLVFTRPIATLGFLEVANYCAGDTTFCGVKEVRLFFSTTTNTNTAAVSNADNKSEQCGDDAVVYTDLWHVAHDQCSRQRLRRAGVFEVTPAQGVSLRKAPAGLLRPRFQTYDLSLEAPELSMHNKSNKEDAWGCTTSDEDEEDEDDEDGPFAIAVGPGTGGASGGVSDGLLGHGAGAFMATTTFAHSLSASMNIRATMAMKRARMTLHERPEWLEAYQPYVTPLLPVGYVCKVRLQLCARTLLAPHNNNNNNNTTTTSNNDEEEEEELRRACRAAQETLKAYMREWVLQPYESCGFVNESGQRVRPVHPSALALPKAREANEAKRDTSPAASPSHNNNEEEEEDEEDAEDDANVVPMVTESIISTCGMHTTASASARTAAQPGSSSAAAQAALLRAPLQVMLELVYVADVPFCLAVLCLNKSLVLQDRCAAWVRRVQVHMDDALVYDSGEAALEAVPVPHSSHERMSGNGTAASIAAASKRGGWFAQEAAAGTASDALPTVTYRTSIKPYVIFTLDAKTLEQVHESIAEAGGRQ